MKSSTLTVTASWGLTALGVLQLSSLALVECVLFPFLCPQIAIFFAALSLLFSGQLSTLAATAAGLTMSLEITYRWDSQANLVNPFVAVKSVSGHVTVAALSRPIIIHELVAGILAAVGNTMDLFTELTAVAIARALQDALRGSGLSFPLAASGWGMTAASGGAHSAAMESLTVWAEIAPNANAPCQPYVTQVPAATDIASQLETCHSVMRDALNPQPPMSPIPGRPVITYGNYMAAGISQNALNYYVYARWMKGAYKPRPRIRKRSLI
jgi:hypothetical protein